MRWLQYLLSALFLAVTFVFDKGAAQWDQHTCRDDRSVIVHLFCWKWSDIAAECERFLGPKGFCGVQVSPPNEHRIVPGRPWWERYQPVSYNLESSSGSRDDFIDMVNRCNNVGVGIYVDAVINHMCGDDAGWGTGSGGCSYNTGTLEFPCVPYGPNDFNCCGCNDCTTGSCNIENYGDTNQVRNCRLLGLVDLKLSSSYVRGKVADFMNDCIDIGVAGFRVDACKHMWPGDMDAIYGQLHDLNGQWWPGGTKAFMASEVIDKGGEPITADEYFHLGRVTEFRYCDNIASVFRGGSNLASLKSWGEGWGGMMNSYNSWVFVDNHDNQRGHGGSGNIITYHDPYHYKLATEFKLAHPYGFTRIMSSYDFPPEDGDVGPPMNGDDIADVPINPDETCGGGWVCEHRWRQITNMVKFRNVAGGEGGSADNWWDNTNDQIAFSRGDRAFIAFNMDGYPLDQVLYTGMAAGTYCDIISGDVTENGCTGTTVTVDGSGNAHIYIDNNSEDPVVAFHAESMSGSGGPTQPPTTPGSTLPPPSGSARTIVFLEGHTQPGQDGFLRGGIDHSQRPGCTNNAATSACAISISHNDVGSGSHYEKYNAWKVGDTKIDWYGAESGQGSYEGQAAEGSPMVWTTDDPSSDGYQPENVYGEHHWMLDVMMDCDETEDGWFELKGFATNLDINDGWETDIQQVATCGGTAGGSRPYSSDNHMARCGFVNVFIWSGDSCTIDNFRTNKE